MNQKVSIITPARDEANSIGSLMSRTKESLSAYEYEIIVVDDGSKDNTKDIARSSSVMTFCHDRSLGKGVAMKSEAGSATGDIFVYSSMAMVLITSLSIEDMTLINPTIWQNQ